MDPISVWVDKVLRFFFFWCLVSPLCIVTTWWLAVPLMLYVPSYLDGSEKTGGRPSEFHKSLFLWHMFKRRMNMKLLVTSELDPNAQYIFGLHPHGILPWGGVLNLATNVNNSRKALNGVDFHFIAASFCFYVPFYRDLLLGGGICDAARVYAERLLCSGKSIGIVPGGATEALFARPFDNTVYIKKRRGFVHLSIQVTPHTSLCC